MTQIQFSRILLFSQSRLVIPITSFFPKNIFSFGIAHRSKMIFGLFDRKSNRDQEEQEQNQDHRHSSVTIRRNESVARAKESAGNPKAVRNSFIAGWTAGVTGTLAGHPLDSLKVWVQTGVRPTAETTSKGNAAGILGTVRRFYSGVGGPVLTVGMIQSINFTVYDTTRRFWYFHFDNPSADPSGPDRRAYLNEDSYTSIGVAGFTAGAVLSVVTSPIYMVKTIQQTQPDLGFRDALRMMRAHPGTGFGVHFAVETVNRSIYFCTYEYLKRYYEQKDENADPDTPAKMSMSGRMISAAAAGINCWLWIYPIDALRSRIYANMAADAPISGMQMAKTMYSEGGWRSFYRGFAITTMRAGPVAAAILPVYDYVLEALNNHT